MIDKEKKSKILIIEDSRELTEILKDRLVNDGYDVFTAYDGEEGLQMAGTVQPDLLVLDLMIPKIDGYKLCEILKAKEEFKNMPVIMLTARASDVEQKIGYAMGADVYLVKPCEPTILLSNIKTLLEKKK